LKHDMYLLEVKKAFWFNKPMGLLQREGGDSCCWSNTTTFIVTMQAGYQQVIDLY